MSQTPIYDALEPQHRRFVDCYIGPARFNATKAAEMAGYSPDSARSQGSRLLTNDDIGAAIAEKMRVVAERCEVTAQRVVQEIARVAFSDLRNFVSWGPEGVTLMGDETLGDDDARCVAEVSETKPGEKGGGSVRIKLHGKMDALKELVELLDITPAQMREMYPSLDADARRRAALTLLKTAKDRRQAASQ